MQRMAFLDLLLVRSIRIAGHIFWLVEWCGGELSSMCSQTASRCRFFTSTVRRWLASSNVFPPFSRHSVSFSCCTVYTCGSYAALPTSPGSTRRPSRPIYKVAIIFLATSRLQQLFFFPKINIYNNLQKCFNDASNNKKIFIYQ
jgi:hypothetical protein